MKRGGPGFLLALLMAGVLSGATLVMADDVGKFSRVLNQVEQLKQGTDQAQPAKVPNGVANQDQVRTREKSMAVVQFMDDSTMTVSPKSKVTIEEYMFDADKGRARGSIKVMEGVVETIIPSTEKLQQKDIQIRTTTAIAGIRGTKLITVAKPEGTVFYVLPDKKSTKPGKSKVRIRMYSADTQPDSPAMRFVAERLQKKMDLRQIMDEGLEAKIDPCALVKAAILLGVDLNKLIVDFQQVCAQDPEFAKFCTPCIILKCTVEALRSLREVEVSEGQSGVLLKNLAPIVANLKPGDVAIAENLPTIGIEGQLPNYPPTQDQINQAKLPGEVSRIAEALIQNGADPTDMNKCKEGMGFAAVPAEALAYSPVAAAEGIQPGTPIGQGQQPTEPPASRF
ncbi:MAG: FecR family protein, partial [Desulfobaccales bacterium]